MHESIYKSPVLIENLEKLRRLGVTVIGPKIEEGLAKIVEIDEIILTVEHILSPQKLAGKRILITSGPTIEPIDPIRVLTNRSSGLTGIELAKAAYREGAEVTLVHSKELNVLGIKELRVETAREMVDVCMNELRKGYDALISAAAISDFTVDRSEVKLPSTGDLQLHLTPTRKLIEEARNEYPELVIVGFKAETNVSNEELLRRAKVKMAHYNLEMVVANDIGKGGIGTAENDVYILRIGTDEIKHVNGAKRIIAEEIVNELIDLFSS